MRALGGLPQNRPAAEPVSLLKIKSPGTSLRKEALIPEISQGIKSEEANVAKERSVDKRQLILEIINEQRNKEASLVALKRELIGRFNPKKLPKRPQFTFQSPLLIQQIQFHKKRAS